MRIYCTATVDAVYSLLCELKHNHFAQFYFMAANWDYLIFKTYTIKDRIALTDYINAKVSADEKVLMYLNDIDKGKELNSLLQQRGHHIYAGEECAGELGDIIENECFSGYTCIVTKVANNAESFEPLAIQQAIGRARVNRSKPRQIEVLIPDLSAGDLGRAEHLLIEQLNEFRAARENPYTHIDEPYSYPSPEQRTLIPNELAIKSIESKLKFIQNLKAEEQENLHAFVRHILDIYGKEPAYKEEMRIDYDKVQECKERIRAAYEEYKASKCTADEMKALKERIKAACNETGGYDKEIKTNIQISTVNELLKWAGISAVINAAQEVYSISEFDDPAAE